MLSFHGQGQAVHDTPTNRLRFALSALLHSALLFTSLHLGGSLCLRLEKGTTDFPGVPI